MIYDSVLEENPNWQIKPLLEVATYISRGKQPKYVESSYIYTLNQKAIQWGGIVEEYLKFHNPDITVDEKHFIQKNDVVINSTGTGTVGRVLHFEDHPKIKMFADSHVTIVRTDESQILSQFLMYQLATDRYQEFIINSFLAGSTGQVELNKSKVEQFPILIPPLNVQKYIVYILGRLDEKISVNKKIIRSLEVLAQTLFTRWFIDFDFLNEEGLPYKSSAGKMVDSELGQIPEGWRRLHLIDICEVKDGTHDSPKQVEKGFSLVTSKHLRKNDIDIASTKLISEEDYQKVNKRSLVERYDILISMIGTVGRLYLVQDRIINFAIKNIGLIKTSQIRDYEFVYCYLQSDFIKRHIEERMAGSTQQYISLSELRKIPILMPSDNVLYEFKAIANGVFEMIYSLTEEIQQLELVRGTLLPKLLSGEIEIPDESMVD